VALYLVTGGAGFIGSSLVRGALARGDRVRVLDSFVTGRRENLDGLAGVDLIEADLCDEKAVRRAVEGVDFIFHEAALPSVPRSVEKPQEAHAANATGTLVLLEAVRGRPLTRLVYASSSSVYGANETLPKVESLVPEPESPYAVSKLTAEHYCLVYHRLHGLPTVALRYFNVFGPRQDPSSPYSGVVSRFMDAIRTGSPPKIYGNGEQSRDFTYIDNVVQVNFLACEKPAAVGRVYNVGCGSRTTVRELWGSLSRLAGSSLDPVYGPPRVGDVLHSLADIGRAKEDLGFVSEVDLEEGLERTLAHYGLLASGA